MEKLANTFQKVCKNVIDKNMNILRDDEKKLAKNAKILPILCPDQVVAQLQYTNNGVFDMKKYCETKHERGWITFKRKPIKELLDNKKYIVIVLESPHIDEFKDECALGPAYGKTGENINIYLPHILKIAHDKSVLKLEVGIYDVILVNAIQYQCSMGIKTKIYRDKVFQECWGQEETRTNFYERMKKISLAKEVVIINCCTKGDNKVKNYELVERELRKFNSIVYRCAHPSSWMSPRNRNINVVEVGN